MFSKYCAHSASGPCMCQCPIFFKKKPWNHGVVWNCACSVMMWVCLVMVPGCACWRTQWESGEVTVWQFWISRLWRRKAAPKTGWEDGVCVAKPNIFHAFHWDIQPPCLKFTQRYCAVSAAQYTQWDQGQGNGEALWFGLVFNVFSCRVKVQSKDCWKPQTLKNNSFADLYVHSRGKFAHAMVTSNLESQWHCSALSAGWKAKNVWTDIAPGHTHHTCHMARDMARDMAEECRRYERSISPSARKLSSAPAATVCGDHCVSFQGPAFGGPFGWTVWYWDCHGP